MYTYQFELLYGITAAYYQV